MQSTPQMIEMEWSRGIREAMGPDACTESLRAIADPELFRSLIDATSRKLKAQGDFSEYALQAILAVAPALGRSWLGIERSSDLAAREWRRTHQDQSPSYEGQGGTGYGTGGSGGRDGEQDQNRNQDQQDSEEQDQQDSEEQDQQECDEGMQDDVFGDLVELLRMGCDVALVGPAGCGKTTMMRRAAEVLGREWTITTAPQMPYDITGFTDGHGRYVEAAYSDAFMGGKLAGVDEGDRASPDALIALHAPVANRTMYIRGKGQIGAADGFQTVMTMNTWGLGQDSEYITANQLDEATRDRFVFLRVGFDPGIDREMAGGDRQLLEFAGQWRASVASARIPHAVLSYRGVERLAKLAANPRFGHVRALEIALVKGLPKHTLETIRAGMNGGGRWLTALDRLIAIMEDP